MTEKKLLAFIQEHKESEILEYKLKPNFNEIQENIKEIQKRMHFNILKAIYAFANSNGGDLYIGVEDKKRSIEGIDSCDKKRIEKILEQVNPKITKEEEIISLKNGRVVIKIKVDPLKIYDKPLFLDGILCFRENDTTACNKSLGDYLSLYEDRQLYMCFTEGIKSNFKQLKKKREPFELNQFIKGLKTHIKSLIAKKQITGWERALKEIEDLLDKIKQKGYDPKDPSQGASQKPLLDFDSLLDKFIELYKKIIS